MTCKHYTLMARWISENSEPETEAREKLIELVFFIVKEDDRTKGNRKLFDPQRFREFINGRDEARAREIQEGT